MQGVKVDGSETSNIQHLVKRKQEELEKLNSPNKKIKA